MNKTMRKALTILAEAKIQKGFVMLIPDRGAIFHARAIWYYSGHKFPAAQFAIALVQGWLAPADPFNANDGKSYPVYELTEAGLEALEAA